VLTLTANVVANPALKKRARAHFLFYAILLTIFLTVFVGWEETSVASGGCGAPQLGGSLNFNAGVGPRSLVTGDFNHDGKNDLAVANYGSGQGQSNGSISILLNNGLGFSAPNNIAAGINPRSIVTADFNKDGNLDLAVLNYVSGSCCISTVTTVFLGDGAGNFTSGVTFAVGNDASALTVGDFNKDGNPDLAATLTTPFGAVAVLLGNGSGVFSPATNYTAGASATSIATGDFNGDGKPDLVTSNLNGFNISVLLGDGSGAFAAPVKYDAGGNPRFIAVGDFNQDSKLDVVTANTSNNASVLLGNGDGSFGAGTLFTVSSSPQSVAVVDVNGDGRLDLATSNSGTNNVSVLIGNGSGGFGSLTSYVVGSAPSFILSNDFNGDLKPDLAIANASSNDVSVLTGDGSGEFGGGRTYNVGLTPLSVASGDFNGDGKIDLAVTNNGQNSVSVLLGNGGGTFGADTKYSAGFTPKDVIAGDFNGDGKLDLAVADNTCCQITQSVSILLGNGNGGFAAPVTFNAGTGATAIVSGDFNRDGKADLAVVNNADNNISILIGNGAGAFASLVNFNLPVSPSDVAVGDFDGDGNTDLAVAGGSGTISILLGNGAGGFSIGSPILVSGAGAITVGDVNGDGRADLGVANTTDSLLVLIGDGSGNFSTPNSFPVPSPGDVVFADFNGDGKVDLAAISATSKFAVLLGDGTGAFGAANFFNAGSSPKGILAMDLNSDGRPDLATANLNLGSTVTVVINSCGAAPLVPPTLNISDVTVPEGNPGLTNASFTLTLSSTSDRTITASYYTSDQTAHIGSDYQPVSGHVTFSPGMTVQTIAVPIVGDTLDEPDETFFVNLANPLNATISRSRAMGTIINDDIPTVQFSASSYTVSETGPSVDISLTRTGDTTSSASVNFVTNDGAGLTNCDVINHIASPRCDYENTIGTATWAAGDASSKVFSIAIVDDGYAEGSETFTIGLNSPSGASLGAQSTATVTITDNEATNGTNPIDRTGFFVRQQYIDFLGREPDPAGFAGWTSTINTCSGDTTQCDRIHVSQLFFQSAEFQQRGYFVYRFYPVAFGRKPDYAEFVPDLASVSGFLSDAQLEAAKVAFIAAFMARPAFVSAYNSLNNTQYVDALLNTAGVTLLPSPGTRQALIDGLNNATKTRGAVLRQIVESTEVSVKYNHQAYSVMEYFGYLRRQPDGGYLAWIAVLDGSNDPRGMVTGFVNSIEYRNRFGP
jgi:hypothetical protein